MTDCPIVGNICCSRPEIVPVRVQCERDLRKTIQSMTSSLRCMMTTSKGCSAAGVLDELERNSVVTKSMISSSPTSFMQRPSKRRLM